MLLRIHVVIEDAATRRRVLGVMDAGECVVTLAAKAASFWDSIADQADLILLGRSDLPDPFAESIEAIRGLPDEPEVVVVVDREDDEGRSELLAAGCYAIVATSVPRETLQATFAALISRRQTELESQVQRELDSVAEHRLADFDSSSPVMQEFLRTVKRVVPAHSSVLILGETGVGKERLARAIHDEGPRADKAFVPVNCAAFPESLLEGELFGHVKGAFTGATADRRGCFEMAHGGTIFLDEIGEVPRHLQVKLLRVLQERQIQRLGSEEIVPIDVRILAATNRDLQEEMEAERFRRDLFYRLGVVTLNVPALREHAEDIPRLLRRLHS